MPHRPTHRDEIPVGGQLFITMAMLLDPVFDFVMVVFFFEDLLSS
jgi:hypothetical protein